MSGTATAPLLPYEPEDPSSARNPQRLWVFILVGVLVLAAVAGFGANRYLSSQDDPNHPVSAGQAKTPAAAVRAYLQALAAGNANDALSFAVTPADTTFLTKEVLMASLALNPITEIATALDTSAPRSSSSATVNAFYKIGLLPVNTTFAVSKTDKYWQVSQPAQQVTIATPTSFNLSPQLNGVALPNGSADVWLFPGTYSFDATASLINVTAAPFVVQNTAKAKLTQPDQIRWGLTSDGQTQVVSLVTSKLNGCLVEQSYTTSCDFPAFPGGYPHGWPAPKTDTIKWSPGDVSSIVSSAQITVADPATSNGRLLATVPLNTRFRVAFIQANGWHSGGAFQMDAVAVDITDPNNMTMTFSTAA